MGNFRRQVWETVVCRGHFVGVKADWLEWQAQCAIIRLGFNS